MYYKITILIILTLCLFELSSSLIEELKSVKSVKIVKNNEEETAVLGNKTLFSLAEKILSYDVRNSKTRRVKRNLPMGKRCATDMREYRNRCWPLDTYYNMTGVGSKLKNALKLENYEEEAIALMKKWRRQQRRCEKKPCKH